MYIIHVHVCMYEIIFFLIFILYNYFRTADFENHFQILFNYPLLVSINDSIAGILSISLIETAGVL